MTKIALADANDIVEKVEKMIKEDNLVAR